MHSITQLMQNAIKSNNNNVINKLNKLLYNKNECQCNEIQSDINIFLQSLIGIIDQCNSLNIHNNEINSCLIKYENDIIENKNIIMDYEQKFMNQQQRLTQLQNNFTVLKKDKLECDQKLNEGIFNITNELQKIVILSTNNENIRNLNMNECIEIIIDSINNNQMKVNQLNSLLNQVAKQYLKQIGSVEQIFKSVGENWSERIHGLQDKLHNLQLVYLRNNGSNNTNLSMSLISDVNKSFGMDNIESQFSEQMILINELKNEINNKQHTIDKLIYKSDNIKNIPKYTKTIKKLKYENRTLRKEKDDAVNDFNNIVLEWQNMESQIDATYNQNEILQKKLKHFEYYIKCISAYIKYKINNPNNNIENYINNTQIFEDNENNNIPKIINKLHNSLMFLLIRMDLPNVNETIIEDINDDILLEKLFGNVENKNDEKELKENNYDLMNDKICKLEAKMCLEEIISKIELSHVGTEAERIIIAYQNKLKKYHSFVKQLQNKISEKSKLMHGITLERDHAWTQYKILENQVNKLSKENETLESNLSKNNSELNHKTQQLNSLINEYENKIDSMNQQLKLDEDTNNNINERLNESTLIIQQITQQRDEFEAKCINITNKFMEYKQNSDMLFKRSFNIMIQSINPFVIKLNDINNIALNKYSQFNEQIENINNKIKYFQDFNSKEKKENEIAEIRAQCENSAIKKLRVHADIHRFQFAKLLQEMKQKYILNMEQLKQKINSLNNKFTKIQNSYLNLQTEYKNQNENKIKLNSQLIQLKKSYNKEIVNYQNVKTENNNIINNLNNKLQKNKQIINELNNENKINITKREDLQLKLNEQNKKCRKLHSKTVKLQTELKEIKGKYKKYENEITELNKLNNALNETNKSLKESLNSKGINNNKMTELYNNKINELNNALENIEIVNNKLNDKCEDNENEINKYLSQINEMEQLNNEFIIKFENVKNEKLELKKEWFEKEEDLRNEINIIRGQLHCNTNELGQMKLNNLEKNTIIKKYEHEINNLNEEINYFKQCENKNKNEIKILNNEIITNTKSNELKINDIQMILNAKNIRIQQLQTENNLKYENITNLNKEIIKLKNEINVNKSLINNDNKILKNKKNENNKLQNIINDLRNELNIIKTENDNINKELETQKNVNVQLSIELDSMQQFKNNNESEININNFSTVSFYDIDLEKSKTSLSMPNMSNIDTTLNADNIIKSDSDTNNYNNNNNNNNRKRRLSGLPIPKTGNNSKLSLKSSSSRVLFGNNAEDNGTNESVIFDL